MKVHPILLTVLVLCALAGAFAVGRFWQVSPATPPPAAARVSNPASVPEPQPVLSQVQRAEVKTPQGTFHIEGSATLLPAPATRQNSLPQSPQP